MTRLAIFREDEFQDEHVLMRATVALGRHPENDIVLNDLTLSRFHARLERRGDAYVVVDLGAQNGVFLNGQKVTGERGLTPGDRIGIGSYVAIFDQPGAENLRRKSDSQTSTNIQPEADAGVSIALDEDSLEDLSIDLDMSSAGVDIEIEEEEAFGNGAPLANGTSVPAEESHSEEAPFFEEGRTAVVQSEIETGSQSSKTQVSSSPPFDPTLVLLYNGLEVSRHGVDDMLDTIIGRSKSSDVVISLLGLSRRHTRVTREGEQIFVEDMGSQNGTWVNNHRIDGKHRIRHGDLLNYYEYGLLFLEDPSVKISPPSEVVDQTGTDDLDAIETGRQDGISIGAVPPQMKPANAVPIVDNSQQGDAAPAVATSRSPIPILSSEADLSVADEVPPAVGAKAGATTKIASAPSVDENYDPFDGFDLDELSGDQEYLADALDDAGKEESEEIDIGPLDDDDDDLKPSHTQILLQKFEEEEQPSYLNENSHDELSSFRTGQPTGPSHQLQRPDGQPMVGSDKTSAMVLPVGLGDRGAWPTEAELEPALKSGDDSTRLVQLEVYLDGKPYTQVPMSQPVVRVGTDARCELALPSAAGLAPWQFTLIPFGDVVVCYRASRDARVVVDDSIVDQAVLHDGDEIDLGRVRVRVRVR